MSEYLTEQEQVEQLKNWIKQYGGTILVGLLLAICISTGWRYWQNYHNKSLAQASAMYDQLLIARAQNNSQNMVSQASLLLKTHPKTPYAQMAAFMLARLEVNKNNYPAAIKQLNWVIDNSNDHGIQAISHIRIARILIAENQAQVALQELNKINNPAFQGLIDEVRGDAYVKLQNPTAAKQAYQKALKEFPTADLTRPLLQVKYDNLN